MFDENLMKLPKMGAVLCALAVLALLQAAAIVGQAFALSAAVSGLWGGAPFEGVMPFVAAFLSCFAFLHLARFAQEAMLDRYSTAQAGALRRDLLGRVFDGRTMLALDAGAARIAAAATDGVDEVQSYLRIIPPKLIGMAAVSVPVLACEFAVDWPSGVILTAMFPVIMFFMVLLGRQARDRSERQYASYTLLTNRFMDTLRGLPAIKSLKAADREAASVHRQSEALRKATVRTLSVATLSSAVLDFCATFGVAAVAMMLAFRLLDGSVSLFTGLLALILAPEYFTPIRAFASDYHASLDGRNSLAAILELQRRGQQSRPALEGRAARPPAGPCAIDFRDASYAYEGAGAGISHVTFRAQGPQKIAVVGKSGSGKSTFAGLAAGFLTPTSGVVDTCPVRYIPQNPYVFRATLDENIRFYNPGATRESVEAAVSAVGLGGLVSELPRGLDTMVGEGARGLSGGEAHRVALARVMLDEDARVLVFDEPTAHLDIETELDLKGPMLALMEGKLAILATHRLHWLDDMDRVVTLVDGRVASDEVVS